MLAVAGYYQPQSYSLSMLLTKKLFLPHSEKRWNEVAMSKHLLHLLHILDILHTFNNESNFFSVVDLHLNRSVKDSIIAGNCYLTDINAQLVGENIRDVVQHTTTVNTANLNRCIEEQTTVHIPLGI